MNIKRIKEESTPKWREYEKKKSIERGLWAKKNLNPMMVFTTNDPVNESVPTIHLRCDGFAVFERINSLLICVTVYKYSFNVCHTF